MYIYVHVRTCDCAYMQILNSSGDEDRCYYNFKCSHPFGVFTAFNNVWSNIGYFMLGFLFLFIVTIRWAWEWVWLSDESALYFRKWAYSQKRKSHKDYVDVSPCLLVMFCCFDVVMLFSCFFHIVVLLFSCCHVVFMFFILLYCCFHVVMLVFLLLSCMFSCCYCCHVVVVVVTWSPRVPRYLPSNGYWSHSGRFYECILPHLPN